MEVFIICIKDRKNVFCSDLEVNYGSKKKADIVYSSLNVDKEVRFAAA